jgi:cytochrome c556
MTRAMLAATAALALLGGCREAADETAGNAANAQEGPASQADNAAAPSGPQAIPAAAVSGEQAKKLMHDRHENYEKFGDSMKVITRELKAASPDLAAVRKHAGTYTQLGPQMLSWFPPGSGPETGKTEAKAEIWQKPDDFAAKARAFNQAATAFQAAAQGSDLAAIHAAHANLGKSCKACHDLYRAEH